MLGNGFFSPWDDGKLLIKHLICKQIKNLKLRVGRWLKKKEGRRGLVVGHIISQLGLAWGSKMTKKTRDYCTLGPTSTLRKQLII